MPICAVASFIMPAPSDGMLGPGVPVGCAPKPQASAERAYGSCGGVAAAYVGVWG